MLYIPFKSDILFFFIYIFRQYDARVFFQELIIYSILMAKDAAKIP